MKVCLLLCLAAVGVLSDRYSIEQQRRGIQLRVTDKGLSYAVQVGVGIMEKDLNGKVLPTASGSASIVNYEVSNMKLSNVLVRSYSLRTVAGQGIQVKVSNMDLNVAGTLHYKLKGFLPISDTTTMKADVKGVSFLATFKVAAKSDGKPSISTQSCKADIGDLDLDFSGGGSFIYNVISSVFSGKLEDFIAEMICKEAKEQVAKRTDAEMKTFPVVKDIDKWASIDYSLTSSPYFTSSYMDAFLKGKFISRAAPSPTQLRIPVFPTSSDASKMAYFWLTDYTLNSAGEVYHKSGALKFLLTKDDPDIPFLLRNFMSTTTLRPFLPSLYKKYPGKPLRFILTSYKAPTAQIVPGAVSLKIHAKAAVQVDLGNNKAADVFTLLMDVNAKGIVSMKNEYLTGTMKDTSFNVSVGASTIGKITIPMQNPIVKLLIRVGLIKQINPLLEKGIPLPKVDDIAFKNSTIVLQQDVIRIGTDVEYTP